jgi:ribosomal protein L18
MASQPINIEANSTMEIQIMSGDRHIHTEGGNYIESNSGVYIQGDYIDMNQDLTQAATQIQDLIEQLKNRGMTDDVAQEQVAKDIANQAQKNPTVKDKLVKWGQSLGDATVSDVVKGAVKLAIRSAGIPLP